MGRQVLQSSAYERWRRRFRAELESHGGPDYVAEVMGYVDEDVRYFGEPTTTQDYDLLEITATGRVDARLRHG